MVIIKEMSVLFFFTVKGGRGLQCLEDVSAIAWVRILATLSQRTAAMRSSPSSTVYIVRASFQAGPVTRFDFTD